MSDTVIRVENLSKLYRLGEVGTGSLAHDVNRWWHRVRGKEDPYLKIGEVNDRTKSVSSVQSPESSAKNANALAPQPSSLDSPKALPSDWVYALKDVSFEVKRGEVLGIIGRNGAGKSTLLKILSRVTTQSSGQIKVKGRIASLLEVGTGFHPELTGRENIFLNGAILGMRKAEIARKFDEIVEFSGCARYIDTPVKRYSSGMYVRLAFAVAAHLEPEILIVDEVLAVGDAEFQKKCLGKMKDVAGHGRTILFVSHNMTAVQSLCNKGVLMSHGQIEYVGASSECVRRYLVNSGTKSHFASWESPNDAPSCELVWIKSMRAVSLRNDDQGDALFDLQTPIDIEIEYEVVNRGHFHITLHFMTENNEVAFTSGCILLKQNESHIELGNYKITCRIPANLLNEAEYSVKLLIIVNGNHCACEKSDVIHIDVKDLAHREIGGYHGREPGPLRPRLEWVKN